MKKLQEIIPLEEKHISSVTRIKRESTPTCHIRLSLKSLTNVSILELVEADLTKIRGTDDPDLRQSQYATSDFSTFLNVLKSSLGSGLLAMPSAFMNSGLLVGCIGTVFVGIICAHCTYILVKTSQALCCNVKKSHLNYPETTETTFQCALKGKFKKYSDTARQITNICILLPHYGVGIIYVLLAAATLKQVFEHYTTYCWNLRWYVLFIAVPLLPVGTVRQMKYMVPFSAVANLFLLVGMALTLYYTFIDLPPIHSRPLYADFSKFPLFLSTLLFGMEGIGVILPIENAMKNPKHFLGITGILSRAMIIVISLSLTMGFFGYVKYGEEIKGSVTLNLPDTLLAQLVKGLVAVAILCTYGLQIMAAAQVIWNGVQPHVSQERQDVAYYTVRVCMVIGHIVLAILVPKLAPVISLIGAFGLTTLGMALPALLETLTFWEDGLGVCQWRLWKNIFLGLAALITLISGTWVSCIEILETYS